MSSREFYRVSGNSIEDVIRTMNVALQRIADRLDKLEGIRGQTSFVGEGLDVDGAVSISDEDDNVIHSME